jgi:putative Holliday junction resolvase
MSKWLAFDLGTQTLGIAVGQEKGFIFPRPVFRFPKGSYGLVKQFIQSLIIEEHIHQLVFGLPLNMNDTASERTLSVQRFVKELKELLPQVTIETTNEQLTTVEAKERLARLGYNEKQQKDLVDSMAAVIILEQYLKHHGT